MHVNQQERTVSKHTTDYLRLKRLLSSLALLFFVVTLFIVVFVILFIVFFLIISQLRVGLAAAIIFLPTAKPFLAPDQKYNNNNTLHASHANNKCH